MDTLIEARNEMVELAKAENSGSLRLEEEDDSDDWMNGPSLEDDDLHFEERPSLSMGKK